MVMKEEEIEESYIELIVGKPVTMRFDKFAWREQTILDKELGFMKRVKSLVFHVIEENGKRVDTVFGMIAKNLQAEFKPYLEGDKYKKYRFTLLKESAAYIAPRLLEVKKI